MTANLGQDGLDEGARGGDGNRRLPDLGHGGGDQMGLDELDLDAIWLQLRTQRSRPVLQERLAAGVGGQQWSWHQAGKRSHSEDQPTFPLHHTRGDQLGDAQRAQAVDRNNIRHFVLRGKNEGHGHFMALAHVVDQDSNVVIVHELLEFLVVGIIVASKVHGQCLGLNRRVLGRDLINEGGQLGFGARHEEEVVAGTGELKGKLLANAIGSTGNKSPAAFGSETAQLDTVSERDVIFFFYLHPFLPIEEHA